MCDPNFVVSDSEEYDMDHYEDHYERGVASFKRTEVLKISRGDTLTLKRFIIISQLLWTIYGMVEEVCWA